MDLKAFWMVNISEKLQLWTLEISEYIPDLLVWVDCATEKYMQVFLIIS
jgi:hypothetical protein